MKENTKSEIRSKNSNQIKMKDLDVGERLERGRYGPVQECLYYENKCAVKTITFGDGSNSIKSKQEGFEEAD